MTHTDLTLYNREGQMIAVAEVKTKLGTTSTWATELRRNMLAHYDFSIADFLLLITPDKLYIWKNAGTELGPVSPNYELNAEPQLRPYFDSAQVDPTSIDRQAFELVVGAWLADLTHAQNNADAPAWLTESGLLDAIKNGRLEYAAAA